MAVGKSGQGGRKKRAAKAKGRRVAHITRWTGDAGPLQQRQVEPGSLKGLTGAELRAALRR